jgi:hypothetical protein
MQRERSAKLGTWGASTVALALSCAGCLVTSELDFQPDNATPVVKRISPPPVSEVPSIGSDACGFGAKELAFKAKYIDEDVDQTLYAYVLVNDKQLLAQSQPIEPNPMGTPDRSFAICVDMMKLDALRCNVVQLFVTDQFSLFTTADVRPLRDDLRVAYLEWYLTPMAGSMPNAEGKPYVSVTDCEPPDGGR